MRVAKGYLNSVEREREKRSGDNYIPLWRA